MTETQDYQVSARLERFPSWPWPYAVLIIVGAAYFFSLFDVLTIGVAAPAIGKEFGIAGQVIAGEGTVVSLLGYVFGAFVFSHISDSLGRKKGLAISLISYSVGSLLTATSTAVVWIYVWRFLTGVGIGADLAIAAAFLSELAPSHVRGKFQSLSTFFGFVGAGVGPFVGFLVIPAFAWGWRLFFVIGALGGLFIIFFRRGLPESPRWLLSKGRAKEASDLLDIIEKDYTEKHKELPPPSPSRGMIVSGEKKVPLMELFSRKHGPRVILVLVVFFLYYVYTYPFLALTTSLLAASGYTIVLSLLVVGLGSLGYAIGSFSSFIFSEHLERKYLISVLFIIQGLSMFGLAIKLNVAEVILSDFAGALSNTFLATMLYIYAAENFPTRARSNGVAATDGLGHLAPVFSIPLALAVFESSKTSGFFNTYLMLGIMAIIGGIIVLFGIRATGRKLEDISE